MTWNDIEAKWAAMTRRVQSDRSVDDDAMAITRAPEQPSLLRDEASEQPAQTPLDRPAT
jgi:uncharacterized protein (DUF2236 family)